MTPAQPWAVFDVDETLIAAKSMFAVLHHWWCGQLGPEPGERRYRAAVADLRDMAARDDRAAVNRAFYRLLAGAPVAGLAQAAQDWFDAQDATLFIPETLHALHRHKAAGHRVVLVSGSAEPFLRPIAKAVGADAVLGVGLETDDAGRCTGEITGIQTIGAGKAQALAALWGAARPRLVVGYGDHVSDAPLLSACDIGFVVQPGAPALPDWAADFFAFPVHLPATDAGYSKDHANA